MTRGGSAALLPAPLPSAPAGLHLRPAGDRAGARPRAPLIGRAGPLVTLFCLSGQRIKAAAAAVGTALSGLDYPSLGGGAAARLAAPGRWAAEAEPVPPPPAGLRRREGGWQGRNTGKERGAERGGEVPPVLGGSPLEASRTARVRSTPSGAEGGGGVPLDSA